MIYPTDLTDSQWQAIKLLLPAKIQQRKRKQSVRAIINGILYVVKSEPRSGGYYLANDALRSPRLAAGLLLLSAVGKPMPGPANS